LKLLLFVTKPYSFSVLIPIQNAAEKKGYSVKWYTASTAKRSELPVKKLDSTRTVIEYDPDVVIVPGNVVPDFWPGLKVQVFHGLGEEKKGHYRVTGFFDLYCTPGPVMTERFNLLAEKHDSFLVRETGWPKLDLFHENCSLPENKRSIGLNPEKDVILYAPTFSPKHSSAPHLFNSINDLRAQDWQWIIKFHDLEKRDIIEQYEQLQTENFIIVKEPNIIPYMKAANVLLTDTSSVAYEFLLLNRPIVTWRAVSRLEKGIDIRSSEDLFGALTRSFHDPTELSSVRNELCQELHPYSDGRSSERLIDTIDEILSNDSLGELKTKNPNWIQRRQIRRIVPI
tara:strand:- start:4153 stop:5175 length:1023 start_codon:yes stop_codon:yes gene_type:complete